MLGVPSHSPVSSVLIRPPISRMGSGPMLSSGVLPGSIVLRRLPMMSRTVAPPEIGRRISWRRLDQIIVIGTPSRSNWKARMPSPNGTCLTEPAWIEIDVKLASYFAPAPLEPPLVVLPDDGGRDAAHGDLRSRVDGANRWRAGSQQGQVVFDRALPELGEIIFVPDFPYGDPLFL